MTNKVKSIIWIILGILSFGMGIIGVFIPFLPTTPFLLLSAGFFFKGSDRLYLWLINHKVFGIYIRNFREYKAIPRNTKMISVITLWATIIASVFLFTESMALRGMLLVIGIGVTIHILHYKTLDEK